MIIPTKRQPARAVDPSLLILYGMPKVGKTSSLAQLPNTIILDTERGSSFINAITLTVNTYPDFKDACSSIRSNPHKFSYIAIDTFDGMERICTIEAKTRYLASNMGSTFKGQNILTELAQGAGYPWLWDVVKEVLNEVRTLAPRVILVCHVKEKLLKEDMSKEDSEGADIDLTGKVRNIVCSAADAIGLLKRKNRPGRKPGEKPIADLYANFNTTDATNCGCRIPRLAGREFPFSSVDDKLCKWEEIYTDYKPDPTFQP